MGKRVTRATAHLPHGKKTEIILNNQKENKLEDSKGGDGRTGETREVSSWTVRGRGPE